MPLGTRSTQPFLLSLAKDRRSFDHVPGQGASTPPAEGLTDAVGKGAIAATHFNDGTDTFFSGKFAHNPSRHRLPQQGG